jgi:hypothetical protein
MEDDAMASQQKALVPDGAVDKKLQEATPALKTEVAIPYFRLFLLHGILIFLACCSKKHSFSCPTTLH